MQISLETLRQLETVTKVRLMTAEAAILLFLTENPGAMSSEIKEATGNSNSTYSLALKRLLDLGAIENHSSAQDGRARLYRLSESFREALIRLD